MPSKLRTAILTFLTLTTAVSLTLIALTARHISFIQNLERDDRDVVSVVYGVWDDARENYTTRVQSIWYLPAEWTMRDTHALLAAGIVGLVLGAASLWMTVRQRDLALSMNLSRKGPQTRHLTLPTPLTITFLTTLTTLALLVGTATSWYQTTRATLLHLADDFLPQDGAYPRYTDPVQTWTFETWNCELGPRLRANQEPHVSRPLVRGLCRQAKAARFMVLPALLMTVLALGVHLYAWRKHHVAVRTQGEAAPPYDEVAWAKQADLEARSSQGDGGESCPVSPVSEVDATSPVVEMAGEGKRRAELMGTVVHGEMDAGGVAAEKSTGERV